MSQRRGITTVVTALIALVAVLGTIVFFTSGSEFISKNPDVRSQQEKLQSPDNTKITGFETEAIQIQNGHSWVSSAGQSVTAFVIMNTGGNPLSIQAISVKGSSVPQSNWYSCGTSCGISANINTELTVDYSPENGVNLASGMTAFTASPISLEPSQATIVYLPGAGSLQAIDSGKAYTVNVQAGKASAVQSMKVVLKEEESTQEGAVPPKFELSNPSWTYVSETDSTFKVTVSNTGDTVVHVDGLTIGGMGFTYSTTIDPKQSHVIVIDTSGIANAEMVGLAYTIIVNTSEGTSRTGSVLFLVTSG